MSSLSDTTLESNKYFKINFSGGDLFSDAGLLLINEFAVKIGFQQVIRHSFKTNDSASARLHSDPDILLQKIFQTIAACLMQFEQIQQTMRRIIYSMERPEHILLDIDSTHFDAYGSQEWTA